MRLIDCANRLHARYQTPRSLCSRRSITPTRASRPFDASVDPTEARKTAPRPSLMKSFTLLSQHRAVELRATQQMLMQFARLKSS